MASRNPLISAFLWLGNLQRRMLTVYLAVLGPRAAYAIMAGLARALYWLLPPLRARSEAHVRAALGGWLAWRAEAGNGGPEKGFSHQPGFSHQRIDPEAAVRRIAADAWVQRVWALTDVLLAERLLHPGTYQRYGGLIPEPHRSEMLDAQRRGQPAILLTAYYGPYDLLPTFLGFNGVRAAAIYRRHPNAGYDELRRRVRARGGITLIPVEEALWRLPQVLEAGGTIAVVADHHTERHGLPTTFLGLPTTALRTVGVLAARHRADVVVAGVRRIGRQFQFAIEVVEVLKPAAWANEPDPVTFITQRYLAALERLILADPSQYSWAYARWGEALTRQLMEGEGT